METIATLTVAKTNYYIQYNRETDTYELLEVCPHYDYVVITGDIFTVANRVIEIYENSIID